MTHAAPDKRRSREGWPETEEPAEWAPSVHAHDMPSWVRRSLLGIGAFMLLFGVGLGCLTYYVYLDHQYVVGRGQYRDAEAARIQRQTTEQIRSAMCDLLDGLPAGPLLDPKREQYTCGPGVAVEQLSPEAQDQLQQFSAGLDLPSGPRVRPLPTPSQPAQPAPETTDAPTPTPTVAPTVAPPPVAADEPAPAPGLPPIAPGPTPAAPPPTEAVPFLDLRPLTDGLCTGLGICA